MTHAELLATAQQVALGLVKVPDRWEKFTEKLCLPQAEVRKFQELIATFQREWKEGDKPYSVCVFGPPGSGKSTLVEELAEQAGGTLLQFNLSQFANPGDLVAAFRLICNPVLKKSRRIVFFDEFDARLAGQPLGWLQWFLAPMEDGKFDDLGLSQIFGSCIFIFGGGTAFKLAEFKSRHAAHFDHAKGPDFVSRLRDHIDLAGINGDSREIRRALLMQFVLKKLGISAMPGDTLQKLLQVGRYRYGSRSLKTIVSAIDRTTWQLPPTSVLEHHVDGGPLERVVVALSAGGHAEESTAAHLQTMKELLRRRAHLIYGYAPVSSAVQETEKAWANNYTSGVKEALADRPQVLDDEVEECIRNLLATGLKTPLTRISGVRYDELKTLDEAELARLEIPELRHPSEKEDDWLKMQKAWSLSLFRMRVELMQEADAVIVMKGKEFGSSGRFPGIAEEVMLALAFKKPVFIVGGFGGAAQAVGSVLGLSKQWRGLPPSLTKEGHLQAAQKRERKKEYEVFLDWASSPKGEFDLPFCAGLPQDYTALCSFLGERSLQSSKWPDNGLNISQNRELFQEKSTNRIAELIINGLEIVFGRRSL
jgi:hypothetical protein